MVTGHGDLEVPDAARLNVDAGGGLNAGKALQDELGRELDTIEEGEAEDKPPEREEDDEEKRSAKKEAELHKKLLAMSY